jgi:hypothetical protein
MNALIILKDNIKGICSIHVIEYKHGTVVQLISQQQHFFRQKFTLTAVCVLYNSTAQTA